MFGALGAQSGGLGLLPGGGMAGRPLLRADLRYLNPGFSFVRNSAKWGTVGGLITGFGSNVPATTDFGLSIEEGRTDKFLYDRDMSNAAWGKTNGTLTANALLALDGTMTANKWAENSTGSNFPSVSQAVNATNGTPVAVSIFAKAAERSILQVFPTSGIYGSNVWANFDLAAGVLGAIGTATTATIQAVGGGWYLCTLTGTPTSTGAGNIFFGPQLSASAGRALAYTNVVGSGLYLWGAQIEDGALATSPIYTTTAAGARAADSLTATLAGLGLPAAGWTITGRVSIPIIPSAPTHVLLQVDDGTANNRVNLAKAGGTAGNLVTLRSTAGASLTSGAAGTIAAGATSRFALALDTSGNLSVSIDGGAATAIAGAPTGGLTRLIVGNDESGAASLNGFAQSLSALSYAASNSNLPALSAAA